MPSSRSRQALLDIRDNIRLARQFTEGLSFERFCGDKRTVYAVTRCLEIISEASRRRPSPGGPHPEERSVSKKMSAARDEAKRRRGPDSWLLA